MAAWYRFDARCIACGRNCGYALAATQGAHLLQCETCGTCWFAERPDVSAHYAGGAYADAQRDHLMAELWALDESGFYSRQASELLSYIGNALGRLPRRALDFGCSWGFLLRRLADHGVEPYGVELDPAVVEYNKTLGVRMLGLEALRSLPDAFFALVRANHVIEHLPDPAETLALLASKLAAGGVLILSTPCFSPVLVAGDAGRLTDLVFPDHLSYFTVAGMAELLRRVGLDVEQCFSQFANDSQVGSVLLSGMEQPMPDVRRSLETAPLAAGSNLFAVARKRGPAGVPELETAQASLAAPLTGAGRGALLDGDLHLELPISDVGARLIVSGWLHPLGQPGPVQIALDSGGSPIAEHWADANRPATVHLCATTNPSMALRIGSHGRVEQLIARDLWATVRHDNPTRPARCSGRPRPDSPSHP